MIIEETKKYLFNAEQAPYLENIRGIVFSNLAEEQKKSLQSVFFSNTPYRYGLIIQVDKEKLPIHCQVSLIHEALASLEHNPEQPELVELLRAYLKLNAKKIKKPINIELLQNIGRVIGTVLSFLGGFYTVMLSLALAGLAMPIGAVIGILISFVLIISTVSIGRKLGEFIGTLLAQHINRNRVQPQFEEKLEQLICENIPSVSIPKQPIKETDNPSLSNESSISSLYFFPQAKFLVSRKDIEKIPIYRNSL